jgi:tetratricopeptide (TPR) repeat protein
VSTGVGARCMLGHPCPGPPLTDSASRLADHLPDRYRIERELGRGGMAVVYRAHDLRHDRPVALKVLRPELAASLGAERFLREIHFAARLQHPNILPLLDSGEIPAEPGVGPLVLWYTMPLVEGESLRERLRRQGQQPLGDALRWTGELADALAYAHARGIVHRDIKPENVLLSGGAGGDAGVPHALLADFGVARALETGGSDRLTESGLALGTPAYMSPEQSVGDASVDGRSDLYSLGCVLYELLTGEPPYTGPTPQAVVAKRLADPVPSARRLRETVPPAVDQVLQRLLAKSPADRFATAAELAAALAAGSAATPTIPPPIRARRPRVLLAAAAVLVVVGALVGVAVATRRPRATARLDPAAVALLPFRVTASDHSLDYLGEGLVDLLAVKLDGSAGARAVPPRQLLSYLGYRPGMEISSDAGSDAARRAGAGRVLDGSLVRSGAGIELSAALRRTDGSGPTVRAVAAGSLDSLPALVDRLAAQLLAGQRGPTTMLGELSSARAIAEYLQGKQAHRLGRYEGAVAHFGAALREDSTFALAALDQIAAAARTNDQDVIARASSLAWASRAKLSPKGQALLRAWLGPKYPKRSSLILELAAWQDAVQAAPDVADAWFELGDRQLHNGGLDDLPHPVELAQGNFRRALELDSSFVMPLDHLLLAKLYLEDTTDLKTLVRRWFAQDTAPGDRSGYMRWRLAVALGDSAAASRELVRLDRWPDDALRWLAGNAQADAVGLRDVPLALREIERRAVTGPKLRAARMRRHDWLLNTGRPSDALALIDSLETGQSYPQWAPLLRIDDALFWDGDTAAAAADVRVLSEAAGAPRTVDPIAGAVRARTHCRLGLWSLSRGDRAQARAWSSRLRAERVKTFEVFNDDDRVMCAGLLDAWLASREDGPEARRLLERADSIYVASDVMDDWLVTDLVTARLRETVGDLPGAVRAIGRVDVALPLSPTYQSTYLRQQARLWLMAGDTASAVRALHRYVALRTDAEPMLRAERDSARAQLAALVGR